MKRNTYTRGMTALEAIVWVAVFTAAMLAISISLLQFYRANSYAIESAQAIASAQHGMDTMIKSMREAAYSSNGAYPVVSIGANDVVFYSDIDADSYVEKLHYYVSGTSLIRGITKASGDPIVYGTESTSTLSDNVQNLTRATSTFRYFDQNGNEIVDYTNIAGVRFITAKVIVNVDLNRQPGDLTLSSSAALRNVIQ